VMAKRFAGQKDIEWINFTPAGLQDEG